MVRKSFLSLLALVILFSSSIVAASHPTSSGLLSQQQTNQLAHNNASHAKSSLKKSIPQVTGNGRAVSTKTLPDFKPTLNSPAGIAPAWSSSGRHSSVTPFAGGNPGDGYCFTSSCSDLTYHGGPVQHNAEFVIDLWVGCGSSSCYSSCVGQTYFDSVGVGGVDDCHYIFLSELFLQDLCSNGASNPSFFQVLNQYTDGTNTGITSCSLLGGSATESGSSYAVNYIFDPTSFPESPLKATDLQASAARVISGLGLTPSPNLLVLVYTPYGISSCSPNSTNCFPSGGFCAYHSYFLDSGANVTYADIPDAAYAKASGYICGYSAYPTGDQAGDYEIADMSHEVSETVTDPLFTGWFNGDTSHEIGDQCAYDTSGQGTNFWAVGTENFDRSNVHLGANNSMPDPFQIQSEWSNYNGGCTLSLNGAPTEIYETITPDSSTGRDARNTALPVSLTEAGSASYSSTFPMSMSSWPYATTIYFWQTPDEYVNTSPVCPTGACLSSGSAYALCLDESCTEQNAYISANWDYFVTLNYNYYDLLEEQPKVTAVGGGSPSVSLNYTVPYCDGPYCVGQGDYTQTIHTSFTSSGDFFAIAGSTAKAPANVAGATGERWTSTNNTFAINSTDETMNLSYNHEYYLTLNTPAGGSFSVSSGWYNAGSSVSVMPLAASGWQFETWGGNGSSSYSGTTSTLSLTMNSPVNETALFYPGITINATPGGSIGYSYGQTSGTVAAGTSSTIYVPPGTSVAFTASPSSFLYQFSGWGGNFANGATLSFSVSSPVKVSANFALNYLYLLLIIVIPVGGAAAGGLTIRRSRRRGA